MELHQGIINFETDVTTQTNMEDGLSVTTGTSSGVSNITVN